MKLNKTETRIVELAKSKAGHQHNRYGAVMVYGHGPEGGKIQEGVRNYEAAKSLVEKGLAKLIRRDTSVVSMGGGHSTRHAEIVIELISDVGSEL